MQSSAPLTIWVPKNTVESWIPDGFVLLTGPDNEKYIAPEFMVPVLDQEYNAKEKKRNLRASSAQGSVSTHSSFYSFQVPRMLEIVQHVPAAPAY
jgi:hypothetical protein